MKFKTLLLDEVAVDRALGRIAHEIIEHNKGVNNVALVGIITRGQPMAKLIADKIQQYEGTTVPLGSLDITLYRDDLSEISSKPKLNSATVPFDVNGKDIVIVDDVIFTGRTVRASLDALIDLGRPKSIQLAVLVDRGHREFPIRPDYVGKNVPTSLEEMVAVKFVETDGMQNVSLFDLQQN